MTKLTLGLRWITLRLSSWFPWKLPVDEPALDQFTADICDLYGLSISRAYRQSVATLILHLGEDVCRKRPSYFILRLKKAQANATAYEKLQDLKKQVEAEKAKIKLEATQLAESPIEPISN